MNPVKQLAPSGGQPDTLSSKASWLLYGTEWTDDEEEGEEGEGERKSDLNADACSLFSEASLHKEVDRVLQKSSSSDSMESWEDGHMPWTKLSQESGNWDAMVDSQGILISQDSLSVLEDSPKQTESVKVNAKMYMANEEELSSDDTGSEWGFLGTSQVSTPQNEYSFFSEAHKTTDSPLQEHQNSLRSTDSPANPSTAALSAETQMMPLNTIPSPDVTRSTYEQVMKKLSPAVIRHSSQETLDDSLVSTGNDSLHTKGNGSSAVTGVNSSFGTLVDIGSDTVVDGVYEQLSSQVTLLTLEQASFQERYIRDRQQLLNVVTHQSRKVRHLEKKRAEDHKKYTSLLRETQSRNQYLEGLIVDLARECAGLADQMVGIKQEMHRRQMEHEMQFSPPPSLPSANTTTNHRAQSLSTISPESLPSEKRTPLSRKLSSPIVSEQRVGKLKKFFGNEPPLLELLLKRLGYDLYLSKFQREKITILELPHITEEQLLEMGIPLGPRQRILSEMQTL